MTGLDVLTDADVELMQGLSRRVAATRLDLVNSEATYGELAWNWGKSHAALAPTWSRRLWFAGGDVVAWGWAQLPHRVRRSNGEDRVVSNASLVYQLDPGHAGLVDEVIDWYDEVAKGLEQAVVPTSADGFALERWAAHGYRTDPASVGDTGFWTQLNQRDLADLEEPALPDGFRFRTAEEAGPEAAVQAHLDAWAPSTYSAEGYHGVRQTAAYRGDLHFLVEAPDTTMAASTIMWFDEVNRTVEFEPVGTHPEYRRRGLAQAMLLHAMHQARAAGAVHALVACLGAPGRPAARAVYYGLGFREISRDMPLIKAAS